MKIQNSGSIQDGVESVLIFHPILSKIIICQPLSPPKAILKKKSWPPNRKKPPPEFLLK
jgi:hypothetical protein